MKSPKLAHSFLIAIAALSSACNQGRVPIPSQNSNYRRITQPAIETTTEDAILRLELVANRSTYSLREAPGRDAIHAAMADPDGSLPAPPAVDMTLRLVNSGSDSVQLVLGGDSSSTRLVLEGPGAMSFGYIGPMTTEVRLGRAVEIAPGSTHEIGISRLAHGGRGQDRSFWTSPGSYRVQAIVSAPDGAGGRHRFVSPVVTVTVSE